MTVDALRPYPALQLPPVDLGRIELGATAGASAQRRDGARREAGPVERGRPARMVVLAALDDTSTAWSVLAMAEQLGDLLGARVRAVHVRAAGAGVPKRLAGIGVPLDVVRGAVMPGIVAAAAQRDVAALVIGARNKAGTGPVLGSTASGVAAAIGKPAMVVPPNADPTVQLRRVLVPLDATVETSLAARPWVESALDAGLEVTALRVLTPEPRPAFTEPLRDRDFLARYCPWGNGAVELVTRIGRTDELVPAVAWEYAADLIVLGWSAELVWGRAPVVQAVLGRSPVPALLVPLPAAQTTAAAVRRISSGPEPLLGPAPGSGG